jgi:hypothetical protein
LLATKLRKLFFSPTIKLLKVNIRQLLLLYYHHFFKIQIAFHIFAGFKNSERELLLGHHEPAGTRPERQRQCPRPRGQKVQAEGELSPNYANTWN